MHKASAMSFNPTSLSTTGLTPSIGEKIFVSDIQIFAKRARIPLTATLIALMGYYTFHVGSLTSQYK